MMADFMTVTLVGGVVDKPELQTTQSGKSLLKLRIKTSRSTKNAAGEWENKDATYWTITAWGEMAENAAEVINEGDIVIALGTISQREWEGRDGAKRVSVEMNAQHIGRSLVVNSRTTRTSKPAVEDPWSKSFGEVEEEPPF
jgi:single-strand DNA-binding protein